MLNTDDTINGIADRWSYDSEADMKITQDTINLRKNQTETINVSISKNGTVQNPYPEGKIGVLEAGSFADILIVNGNPIEDLDVLDNMLFIMKNAKVYKNRL